MSERFIKESAFLLLVVATFATCSSIFGQCVETTYSERVFKSVSHTYRKNLTQRFERFLQLKCEERMGDVYEMMVSSFRGSNDRNDFVKEMEEYYSGDDRFVSFTPKKVSEFKSPERVVSFWFIEGCLAEVINGERRARKTILEAHVENGEIFFTDITTRPNPFGNNQKCRP